MKDMNDPEAIAYGITAASLDNRNQVKEIIVDAIPECESDDDLFWSSTTWRKFN